MPESGLLFVKVLHAEKKIICASGMNERVTHNNQTLRVTDLTCNQELFLLENKKNKSLRKRLRVSDANIIFALLWIIYVKRRSKVKDHILFRLNSAFSTIFRRVVPTVSFFLESRVGKSFSLCSSLKTK